MGEDNRGGTGRVDYLDGIRAVAILAVLGLHWLSWYGPFFRGGSVGVDVFFVLSGFIITTMLWRAPAAGTVRGVWLPFLRRRAVRLYPALLGLVVGAVLLWWLVPATGLPTDEVARRGVLTLAQASSVWAAEQEGSFWLPELQPFGQAWSLAVEWYFYLLWPLVLLAARRRGAGAGAVARVTLVAAAALYAASLTLDAHWFYFGPTARSAEILAGAALALWMVSTSSTDASSGDRAAMRSERSSRSLLAAVAMGGICAYAVLGPAGHNPLYRYLGIPVAVLGTTVLIRAAYDEGRGPVHRLLSHRWMALVGRHSYSLYLWHLIPVLLLADVRNVPKPLLGLLTLLATAGLTAASYRWLEKPFLRPRSDVLRPHDRGSVSGAGRAGRAAARSGDPAR